MNEMSEINRLIKKAIKNTYKTLINIQNQSSKKTPTNVNITNTTDKTVKFIDNKGKETKNNNKFPKRKDDTKKNEKIRLLNLTMTQ